MLIVKNKKILEEETVVALGNFDGIHIGHEKLLKEAKKKAVDINKKLAVITFDDKLTVKKNKGNFGKIMSFKKKCEVLKKLGVDILYLLEFDDKLKNMPKENFIKNIIIDKVKACSLFAGFNFKFGKNAEGDIEFLKTESFGLDVNVVEAVKYGGQIVSSTILREYIKKGDIENLNRLLVYPFEISGKVIRGKGRGKLLGFATANLKCDEKYLAPRFGVYETITFYNGIPYKSLTNVGENPTFGDIESFSIETHLLDFEEEIYGEKINVQFVKFIRDEIKFTSIENLVNQVKSDIVSIRFAK